MAILALFDRFVRGRIEAMGGRVVEHVIDGYRISSYELEGTGDGPPAVLLHGLGGSANSFFAVLRRMRHDWGKLYVPDLPGHGFSELGSQPPLDVWGQQRLVARYLDIAVRSPAVLVGNSMGGAIALKTALDRPDVIGLGLLSPAGAPLGESGLRHVRSVFDPSTREKTLEFLYRLVHRQPFAMRLVAGEMQERLARTAVQHVLETASADDRLDEAHLRALTIPIVLVWGASEKILPAGGLEYFRATLPPQAHIEVLAECGHLPMMEQPARTAALLAGLARHVAAVALPQTGQAA